jgi:hypothetical protein
MNTSLFFLSLRLMFVGFLVCETAYAAAPNNLLPEERTRYERGVSLNKEIALYGLETLVCYKAQVVSIKPATEGAQGSDIELRTQTKLTQEPGKPWFRRIEQPLPPRTLHWHWPDNRPIPVCAGFWIEAYADAENRVRRICMEPGVISAGIYLVAQRRMKADAPWEICLVIYPYKGKKSYLVLQPDFLNFEDRVFQIEWNEARGLAVSNFRVKYAEGDEGNHEVEGQGKSWLGWPLANIAGRYVRPGRDGWKSYWTVARESNEAWQNGGMIRLIAPGQYIGTTELYAHQIP